MQGGVKEQEQIVELKPKINPELVKKYKEVFDGYDKQQEGFVQAKDVPSILRTLGVSMSESEVTEALGDRVIQSGSPLISAKISFADFLALVVDKESEMTMKEELMQSFRVFDIEKSGILPVAELRYFLRSYGVPMPEEEVEELIKDSEPQDGMVKYQKFIDKMLEKS